MTSRQEQYYAYQLARAILWKLGKIKTPDGPPRRMYGTSYAHHMPMDGYEDDQTKNPEPEERTKDER